MDKKISRLRRAKRARMKIKALELHRLTVHRTPRHIYAQIVSQDDTSIVVAASTLDSDVKQKLDNTGNILAAVEVGKLIAERAVKEGVTQVAFDRSGFKYHGRVKALADAARENGLQF
ncbi:MAG TPA: 50S ribosomal protein L18 [Gammaproteobacteria bacterium]|nr:50S ribosomal protein L18 [Gammaproteobacteria bacterium]